MAERPGEAARLADVTYAYASAASEAPVVDGFSLTVPASAVTLLRGPSGCGKSTVLRLLAGLATPDAGVVVVAGVSIGRLSTRARSRFRARNIGYLFQDPPDNLLEELTAVQQVMFGARLRRASIPAEAALRRLDEVGVADLAARRVHELSGGQQQRIAVAAVLAGDPGLIVADEPTAELDGRNGQVILDLLERAAHAGRAVVLASHEPSALRIADHVVDLTGGDGR